jgi:hypothetical protein
MVTQCPVNAIPYPSREHKWFRVGAWVVQVGGVPDGESLD